MCDDADCGTNAFKIGCIGFQTQPNIGICGDTAKSDVFGANFYADAIYFVTIITVSGDCAFLASRVSNVAAN